MHKGRVVFGAMDEVVFGRPASEVIVEQMDRLGASRAFLMVSGTLNRETDVIENIRRALGPRCVGTFDAMPAAYAARGRDRGHRTGPRRQRRPHRHRRRRLDHRRRQGGAALPRQRHHAPSKASTRSAPSRGAPPPMNAPTVRQISVPTTIAGGEFTAIAGVTNERTKVKEMLRHPLVMPRAAILDPAIGRAHAGMAVAVDRHPRRRSLRRRHLLARGASLCRRPGAEGACRCWRRRCRG